MNPIPLHDWSVTTRPDGDGYTPPELLRCLQGRVDPGADPRHPEGGWVLTSPVFAEGINGRFITTRTGTVYELKEPAKKYLDWLLERGYFYDPKNPIGAGDGSRKVRP